LALAARTARIGLQVDLATRDPRAREGVEHGVRQVGGQLDERVLDADRDLAEVRALETTLVRQRTDDHRGPDLVPLAHREAVRRHAVGRGSLGALARLARLTRLALHLR